MKIYLSDQTHKFLKHFDFFKTKKVMVYDRSRLIEKTTIIEIETTKKLEELNLYFLFDYHIFPKYILTSKKQWSIENRKMQIGDTILQQVYIPPSKRLSLKIIFGVRIKEIIDQADKKGFSYETIEGHVEKGISTFTVEQLDDKIIFKIQTYSTPGNVLSKIVGSIFSIPYQTFCTRKALENVKRQIENQKK